MKTIISTLLIGLTTVANAATIERSVDRVCDKPEASLYKTNDMNKPVPMQLIVDYSRLNSKDGGAHKGVAVVEGKKGSKQYLPVFLQTRGNSRGSYCEAPPLRMSFIAEKIADKIKDQLKAEGLTSESEGYLKRYYDALQNEQVSIDSQTEGVKNGLFESVGDDIKIVTHCGVAGWEFIGGKDEATQNLRVMSEFYIYQMLAEMRMPVEMTRLATVTYFNADGTPAFVDGGMAKAKIAFFREPPKSVAQRCGLESKADDLIKDNPGMMVGQQAEPTTEFVAEFMNKLVYNNDYAMAWGHNSNKFFNKAGQNVYGAYDFDLSGIISKGYFKNLPSVEENIKALVQWIKNYPTADQQTLVYRTLSTRAAMQKVINAAELPADQKANFQKWIDLTFDALAGEIALQVIQGQEK